MIFPFRVVLSLEDKAPPEAVTFFNPPSERRGFQCHSVARSRLVAARVMTTHL